MIIRCLRSLPSFTSHIGPYRGFKFHSPSNLFCSTPDVHLAASRKQNSGFAPESHRLAFWILLGGTVWQSDTIHTSRPVACAPQQPPNSQNKCGACQRKGHNFLTCTNKAANLVRKMDRKIKNLEGKKTSRKPMKAVLKKSQDYAKKAKAKYTKQPDDKSKKGRRHSRGRCPSDFGEGGNLTLMDMMSSKIMAVRHMQRIGYFWKPDRCPGCVEKTDMGTSRLWPHIRPHYGNSQAYRGQVRMYFRIPSPYPPAMACHGRS